MSSVPLLYDNFLKRKESQITPIPEQKESELEKTIWSKIEQLEKIQTTFFNNFGEFMNICPIIRDHLNFAIQTFKSNMHKKDKLFNINRVVDDLTASTLAIIADHFKNELTNLGL